MKAGRHKTRLIILEGPAGVGKTTLQEYLYKNLTLKGLPVSLLPEFTNHASGKLIKKNSKYGQQKPEWLIGMGGMLAFLSDKITALEEAVRNPDRIWICDRFIATQFVLGLKGIEDKKVAEQIIRQINDWARNNFSVKSCLVLLDAPLDVLRKRLSLRMKRNLTPVETELLKGEMAQYSKIKLYFGTWQRMRVKATDELHEVGDKIITELLLKWKK